MTMMMMTLKFSRVPEVVEVHVHAKFHQAESSGTWVIVSTSFFPYLAMVKNPKIRSCDLDLWPMIFKINGVRAVATVAYMFTQKFIKLHACSASWVIVHVHRQKITPTETIQSVRYHADSNQGQGYCFSKVFRVQAYCIMHIDYCASKKCKCFLADRTE